MRPDHQKLNATQESGAKDEAKDLASRNQPRAESKQGHQREESGQGHVLRRDGDGDGKESQRSDG